MTRTTSVEVKGQRRGNHRLPGGLLISDACLGDRWMEGRQRVQGRPAGGRSCTENLLGWRVVPCGKLGGKWIRSEIFYFVLEILLATDCIYCRNEKAEK